ncbi:MAG: RNA pyrophosphohydrolase [Novosphingobium sp.]|nr:RNA pyrophosphohydrolase [Novosphingobium sp.]
MKAEDLPYRPCAGVMVLNRDGLVWAGRRIAKSDSEMAGSGHLWQMPQGGIDKGEDIREAALRELGEETGLMERHVTIIAQTREELFYDLPDELIGKLWKGKYRGQRQNWFLARLTGTDADIRLDAHQPPEFCDWKWVVPDELPNLIVPFKKRVYRTVLDEFRDMI